LITTVLGNYPKIGFPKAPNLRTALNQLDQKKITEAQLKEVEDEVSKATIQDQVEAGIDLVTDGQIRWEDGQTYFARKMSGFNINGLIRYFDTNTYYRQPIVEGKVTWREPISVGDFQFARANSSKPVKAVITGPYTLARLSKNQFYERFEDFILDLSAALNREALALQTAGATFIQFDEPSLLKNKHDLPLFAEAAKILTGGLSAKTCLCTYFGDIEGLYPKLFDLPFHAFGLDFVVGSRNFDIIDRFPQDKELGLGIIDARNTRLETIEEIVEAVRKIRRVVPSERLFVSPNCGLEFLPRANAYNKMLRMVQGARQAQKELK